MNSEIELFIKEYLKEIEEDNAAIFAGTGLSVPAGAVDWKSLLKPLADELGLDIDKEYDLVTLAQFHCNENGGNRSKINQLLLEELSVGDHPTDNHKILARLPICTYWTTNYDKLIETALRSEGKVPDVKYTVPQLATTKPKRDAVIYKMHGDIDHPDTAVITKDDYEKYSNNFGAYINALSGDLVSKTFLFLGFSFTDPNLDYILSRVRITFRENQRRHYCIFRKRSQLEGESDEDFKQAEIRQRLVIEDLKRFNIKTILIDDFQQITDILSYIEGLYKRRKIFISGSADVYDPWGQQATEEFLFHLCSALIEQDYKMVTGVGRGIGYAVVSGAINGTRTINCRIDDRVSMRPFPLVLPYGSDIGAVWEDYRQDMIPRAGIALFLLGNKYQDGNLVLANGVRREFEIAREHGLVVVPIGASGYMAKELWTEVDSDFDTFYPNPPDGFREAFSVLGVEVSHPNELIQIILDLVHVLTKEG
ncbi:SIR2-like domain-containing protein [Malonomonas rubra DSM 5091]|uniref:NAD(+) hydrolase ThsA n=1 Tax=Malonomonas rubra DSM 5091 TaxID=1122189 RepID=A0A1M6KWQ8_MALRU|nr:SIR2 family protein [Malonomonas rubra]SHJ63395.1 SIR2-like domain-containing protein [Malonomonas rubra DSM 5091]